MERGESLFIIHFSFGGHEHRDFDVLVPRIQEQAERFFSPDPSVRNVFLDEFATGSISWAKRFKALYTRVGSYFATHIYYTHDINPESTSVEEFNYLARLHSQTDLEKRTLDLAKMNLVSGDETLSLFLDQKYQMFDRLAQQRQFELDFEAYDSYDIQITHKQFANIRKVQDQKYKVLLSGDVEQALRLERSTEILLGINLRFRNERVIRRLMAYSREANKHSIPTRIFIRFGQAHYSLEQQARQNKVLSGAEIESEHDFGDIYLPPDSRLAFELSRDPKKTITARELLEALFSRTISISPLGRIRSMYGDIFVTGTDKLLEQSTDAEIFAMLSSIHDLGVEQAVYKFISSKTKT